MHVLDQSLCSSPQIMQWGTKKLSHCSPNRILDCQRLFTGTIDSASIHPCEVVRAALNVNACAAILAHNHPSGVAEPSAADGGHNP
jgi:DNA repair protein RadC